MGFMVDTTVSEHIHSVELVNLIFKIHNIALCLYIYDTKSQFPRNMIKESSKIEQ